MDRIKLRVLGLSYARLKNSAYMLILSEVGGQRHINIWIGDGEAQSIAVAMEGIHPPRPLTHDLFVGFGHAFGIKLEEVFISKVEDDVFWSELTFSNGERRVVVDSRTSDAVALALRTGAPIYTTREILEQKGFFLEMTTREPESPEASEPDPADSPLGRTEPRLDQLTVEELERTLQRLIDDEDYEQAAKVSEILRRKRPS